MFRWLIVSLLTAGFIVGTLSAQETPPPKTKAKVEPKGAAPKTKAEAPKTGTVPKPKTEPPKAEALDEATIKERASYAIGMNFGKNLAQGIKQDGADVDLDLLVNGIKDALTEAKPAYNDQELKTALDAFGKALEAKSKKVGEDFLAQNKKKKDVQTTPSGLQYKVIKAGDGKAPQKTDTVRVHYHGTLPDGTVFDSSKERGEPIEFPVTGVIKGWTEALLKMKVGDKWILYIPSDLAYGPQRRSEVIGPNQVLVFEVELLGIVGEK